MKELFDIPPSISLVLDTLEKNGFQGWLVGGCVRDALRGCIPDDYDVTTNALPQEVLQCFSHMHTIETGIKHGTVTVMSAGEPVEITTFRIESGYSDNRHPDSVSFTRSLRDDLSRRDFTVNAMAYSPAHGLVDPFGGQSDLAARVIRCVGDPDTRFNEDGLRIMRALRFSSVLDFEIDTATADAALRNRALLDNISVERIYTEFKKLLCGKRAAGVLRSFAPIVCQFIPELEPCIGFDQQNKYHHLDVFEHTLAALDASAPDVTIRLALFFHDISKPKTFFTDQNGGHFYGHPSQGAQMTKDILTRLKSDRATIECVCRLVELHDSPIMTSGKKAPPQVDKKRIKRLLRCLTFDEARMLIEIKRCDRLAHSEGHRDTSFVVQALEIIDRLERDGECISLSTLKINGGDLMAMGVPRGKTIGKILNALLELVIDEVYENEREALLGKARELLDSISADNNL